jgi:hypothetical protein
MTIVKKMVGGFALAVLVLGALAWVIFYAQRPVQHLSNQMSGGPPPYETPAQFRGGVCDLVAVDQQCLQGDAP